MPIEALGALGFDPYDNSGTSVSGLRCGGIGLPIEICEIDILLSCLCKSGGNIGGSPLGELGAFFRMLLLSGRAVAAAPAAVVAPKVPPPGTAAASAD